MIKKDEYITKMSEHLKVLRTILQLSQSNIAIKIGISRQTFLQIENGKQIMKWNTFMALLSLFNEDKATSELLIYFGIYNTQLRKYLVSSDSTE